MSCPKDGKMCWEAKVSCNETVGTDLFIFLSLFLVSRTSEDFFFFLVGQEENGKH